MSANTQPGPARVSVLAELRSLIPNRPLDFAETLILAERQAARLLHLQGVTTTPVPSEIVTDLPRITVVHHHAPMSGVSHWNGMSWIITLNARDPRRRRRVTLLHEFAHIIWHGHEQHLFGGSPQLTYLQAEQAADHFASNVLIPEPLIIAAWAVGIKHVGDLAELFEVSEYTILARLIQLRVWLPTHHRRYPHWSQLLSVAVQSTRPLEPAIKSLKDQQSQENSV